MPQAELAAVVHAMVETGIKPDFITVDGAEGGTGAAPPEFSNSVGMPLVEALVLVHQLLIGTGLRQDIKIISSGTRFQTSARPPDNV
jgi:glutamate synthase domain-containing protein 2